MKGECDGTYANQTFNFHADGGFTSWWEINVFVWKKGKPFEKWKVGWYFIRAINGIKSPQEILCSIVSQTFIITHVRFYCSLHHWVSWISQHSKKNLRFLLQEGAFSFASPVAMRAAAKVARLGLGTKWHSYSRVDSPTGVTYVTISSWFPAFGGRLLSLFGQVPCAFRRFCIDRICISGSFITAILIMQVHFTSSFKTNRGTDHLLFRQAWSCKRRYLELTG